MPRRGLYKLYKVRSKKEFIEIIKNSKSFSGAIAKLNCNRRSLMKYFQTYNVKVPKDWVIENKLLKLYVKAAIKKCNSLEMEDIMDVLFETMPEEIQERIKYNQIEEIKNELFNKLIS